MRPSQKVNTFPDGVVEVYEEENRKLGALRVRLRFAKYSVGISRYYQAQTSVASNRIDRVIKVPHTNKVDRMNIVLVKTEDDRQYRLHRIQEKPEEGFDLWELESVAVALKKKE
jgi:hypothetical protein